MDQFGIGQRNLEEEKLSSLKYGISTSLTRKKSKTKTWKGTHWRNKNEVLSLLYKILVISSQRKMQLNMARMYAEI